MEATAGEIKIFTSLVRLVVRFSFTCTTGVLDYYKFNHTKVSTKHKSQISLILIHQSFWVTWA